VHLVLYATVAYVTAVTIYESHAYDVDDRVGQFGVLFGAFIVSVWWPAILVALTMSASAELLRGIAREL
jgi:hypothetical protein